MNYEEYVARIDAVINVLDEIERIRKAEYEENIEFLHELKRKIIYKEISEDILQKINSNVLVENVNNDVHSTFADSRSNVNVIEKQEKKQEEKDCFEINAAVTNVETAQRTMKIGYANPKYEKHLDEFMDMARKRSLPQDYLKLVVSEKYASDIVTRNYETWQVYAHKNRITLTTTDGTGKYNAYAINGEYFYIMPDNSLSYRENGIIQNAVLTYFNLPMETVLAGPVTNPVVVQPAVAEQKNGEFFLIEKGIIKFGNN